MAKAHNTMGCRTVTPLTTTLVLCVSLLAHSQVEAAPNLKPFQPPGWSGPIVTSNVKGTHTDSVPLLSTQKLYVDWAILNDGTDSTTTRYYVTLSLDGQDVATWFVDPPHGSNFYVRVEDFELGSLSAGTHTLRLIADSTSQIAESNEADNTFSKTITITAAQPDLTPYQPFGWSAPIVVSNRKGTNGDSQPLYAADILFIDWAVINNGNGPTSSRYVVTLFVDGVERAFWPKDPPHNVNFYVFVEDFELGSLSPGSHTLRLVADSTSQVSESNESDNTFTKTITIREGTPNLTHYQPPGWSAPIVVSKTKTTNTDGESLISSDTLFIDWAVLNDGTGTTNRGYSVTLYVDGQDRASWFKDPPHKPNFYIFVEDFELGRLSAGKHTLKLKADSSSVIDELNESDNEFTREITVAAGAEPSRVSVVFPKIQKDRRFDTGVAIANPTDAVAEVELWLLGDDGHAKTGTGITNPVVLSVPPNEQVARISSELFGGGGGELTGWIFGSSKNLGVVGFFLTFSQDLNQIDGAEAVTTQGSGTIVFPEMFSGEGEFTEITVVGAGSVLLELRRAGGALLQSKTIELPSDKMGRFTATAREIFTGQIPPDSYVLARSAKFSLVGYQSFGATQFLGGRNAIPVSEIGRKIPVALFGAQLADTRDIGSTITVINPTDATVQLSFSAFRTAVSSGTPSATKTTTLGPKSVLKVDARTFLNLPTGDFVGWLRIDSDVAGVVGDVTFGDRSGNFLSSVQLQVSPLRDVVFSHVADGLGFFTGLTFLNVSADPATVTVDVFNAQSQKTGTGRFILQPFEHRPRLLPEIIPGFRPQVGGYIRVTSNIGIFMFELFGFMSSAKLTSLAAVPPQRGHGTIAGKVTPVSVASGLTLSREENSFEASYAKGIRLSLADEFVPGEIVLRLQPKVEPEHMWVLAGQHRLQAIGVGGEGLHLLRLNESGILSPLGAQLLSQSQFLDLKKQTLDLVEDLNRDPSVLYTEPNYIYHAERVPNDTFYTFQWHYPDIGLPAAWNITTGSSGVVIAVVDTGAKFNHPDLGPRLTGGQLDFISDPQVALDGDGMDPNAEDPGDDPRQLQSSFHGTHVAGTIGAATDNGRGVAGVNWISPLMTLRVLGKGGMGTSYDISQAILYAAGLSNASGQIPGRKANAINLSLGGASFSQAFADAIAAAQARDVVVVAAAGNENSNQLSYPASYDGVISVGATDFRRAKAPYSNFGSRIDVVAPGGNLLGDLNGDRYPDGVLSTVWDESKNQPSYDFFQGTSMAAPHVAGVVSLMLSVNPSFTPSQVRQILQQTAIDLGEPGKDDTFGFGLINPAAALRAAGATLPATPRLVVSTSTMNFGRSLTQIRATISNGGGGTLEVDPPKVETDQGVAWLSATLLSSSLVVHVNRAGLGGGSYRGRVRLTSNGGNTTIEVLMEVGGEAQNDVGTIFVVVLDPATFNTIGGIATSFEKEYRFTIPPSATGAYFVAAGTDSDKDGFICDEGELCGFYPVTNEPSLVSVRANQVTQGINFTVEKNALQKRAGGDARGLGKLPGFAVAESDLKSLKFFGEKAAPKIPPVQSRMTERTSSSSRPQMREAPR